MRHPRRPVRLSALAGWLLAMPAFAADTAADPLAGATLTVFNDGAVRHVSLGAPETPTMTVFTENGAREVALPASPQPASTATAERAAWVPGTDAGDKGYFRLSHGYRHDKTRFNIASDASGKASPNVISELTWEMPNAEIRLDAGFTHASGFTLRGHLAYARTLSGGRVQDSDYLLDDRQAEYSRSYSDPKGSTARDLSFGVGWRMPLADEHDLTPMIGLARYSGRYRMRNGEQIIPALGDFSGLDNNYEPEWRSGWIGLESESRPNSRLTVRAGLKHHWFSYEAEANWNLRTDFAHPVSFRQNGHGTGWEAELGADWAFLPRHSLSFDLSGRSLRLKDGNNVFYLANGQSRTQQLNGVFNDSWAVRLGYRFDY